MSNSVGKGEGGEPTFHPFGIQNGYCGIVKKGGELREALGRGIKNG